MKCNLNTTSSSNTPLPSSLDTWLKNTPLSKEQQDSYASWLNTDGNDIKDALTEYFSSDSLKETITPVWLYHEDENSIATILINQNQAAPEPGEYGSLLAYARAYGYDEKFLCSDCYGQLSCSSCAVEVLQGKAENPTPKDEEYDMLDIDLDRPPTKFTRLSCQTVVGNDPLFCKIRKN